MSKIEALPFKMLITFIVILAANILAYLYKLHDAARQEFFAWSDSLSSANRLAVPSWAASEYLSRVTGKALESYTPKSREPKARTRTVKRERNWAEIESKLREFLASPTPITVREAARRLNIDTRLLYLRVNMVTRQLGERWKEYLRRRQDEHVVNAWPHLEQACIDIWAEGKAVTLREVIARVPAPILAPLSNLLLNLKDVQSHLLRPDFESEAEK